MMGREPTTGRLVALCGIDGSGKATQTELLAERLEQEGHPVARIAFPRYGEGFFADLIESYLRGELEQDPRELSPYLAALPYACDRWQAVGKLNEWLAEGRVVVCDRYVAANLAYQGARLPDPRERERFLRWDEQLEYGVFGLPRPDLQLLLDVTPSVAARHLDDRRAGKLAAYGAREATRARGQQVLPRFEGYDIHEADTAYLQRTAETYRELVARDPAGWAVVRCVEQERMLTRERIAQAVWAAVAGVL